MKRILSILLVMTMVLGLFNATAFAATTDDLDQSIDQFITEVKGLSNKAEFVDLVVLVSALSDTTGFNDTLKAMYAELNSGQVARLEKFGASLDASTDFAKYVMDEDFQASNLRAYLGIDDDDMSAEDEANFKAALTKRSEAFETYVMKDNDPDAIFDGFDKMDKLFNMLKLADDVSSIEGLPESIPYAIKFIEENSNGNLSINTTKAGYVIAYANAILTDDIDDGQSVIDAMKVMVTYYNDSNATDQTLIFDYLDKYGFVEEYTSTGGGGSGGGSGSPSTPTDETPTDETPSTPSDDDNAQDAVEKESTTTVEAQVETRADGKKVAKSEVSSDAVAEAVAKVTAAIEKTEKQYEDAGVAVNKKIQQVAVFEVKSGESADAQELSLPLDQIKKFETEGKLDAVKVKTELGSVTFDTESLFDEDEAPTGKLSVAMEKVEGASLSPELANEVIVDFKMNYSDGEEERIISQFKKPVIVNIPTPFTSGQVASMSLNERRTITAFYIPETNSSLYQPMGGYFDETTSTVQFGTIHFSKYFVKKSVKTFTDVDSSNWAYNYITTLAGKGFINGVSDDAFAPTRDITRAEFVAIVARMQQVAGDVDALPFTDVAKDAWYAEDLAAAYEAGYISGKTATTFEPTAKITRQEVAKVLTNVLEAEGVVAEVNLSDIKGAFNDFDSIGKWAANSVATVYREGIISGKPGNNFDPSGNATRAEVAKMLTELYFSK